MAAQDGRIQTPLQIDCGSVIDGWLCLGDDKALLDACDALNQARTLGQDIGKSPGLVAHQRTVLRFLRQALLSPGGRQTFPTLHDLLQRTASLPRKSTIPLSESVADGRETSRESPQAGDLPQS
jgi:hypothetical protein